MVTAALAVWVAWWLTRMGAHLALCRAAVVDYAHILTSGVFCAGSVQAAGRDALMLAAAAAVAWGLWGIGAPVRRMFLWSAARRWERTAIGVLLGFAVLGSWIFGLAMAGLLYVPLVWGSWAVAFVLLGGTRLRWRDVGFPRVWSYGGHPVLAVCACFPAAVAFIFMFLPDTNGDAYPCYLAVPATFLRVHRFSGEAFSVMSQYPLTAEFVDALAISAGQDAFTHFLHLIPFVAGLAILVGWVVDLGGAGAGWITAGGVLSFGLVIHLMIIAKNDLVAAAYPLAGAVCLIRGLNRPAAGWLSLSAVLFGCGAIMKYPGLVWLGLAWLVLAAGGVSPVSRRWRSSLVWLAVAILPFLAWMLKSWVLTGDPLWPLGASLLPGALWDAESDDAVAMLRHRGGVGVLPSDFPAVFVRALAHHSPAAAIVLPVGLLGVWNRGLQIRRIAAFAAGGFVLLWLALPLDDMRYALVSFLLLIACLSIIVAGWTERWQASGRRRALGVGVLLACLPIGGLLVWGVEPDYAVPCLTGRIGVETYLARRLTTYWEAGRALETVPGLGKFMSIGEEWSYHLPGRCLPERCFGRTWAWVLAKECATDGAIRKRVRQAGCRWILYNFVKDALPNSYAVPFVWDDRMLGVWKTFTGRYLEVAVRPKHVDYYRGGGFVIYHVRDRPLSRPPDSLPYLPGIASLYERVARAMIDGDAPGWLEEALALERRVPGVDEIGSMVGRAFCVAGRWREAWEHYRPAMEHGTVGVENTWGMACALAGIGKREEAWRQFEIAVKLYPFLTETPDAARAALKAFISRSANPGPQVGSPRR